MATVQLGTNPVVTRTRVETPPKITMGLIPPELTSYQSQFKTIPPSNMKVLMACIGKEWHVSQRDPQ